MKGLRTMLFNGGVAAATAFLAMIDPALLTEAFGAGYGPFIIVGINVANMILRTVTNSPVGKAG